MRRRVSWFIIVVVGLTLSVLSACSIESAFPNEKLDYYWRFDRVEYKEGVNFFGDSCASEDIDDTMFGFERHIVVIEDLSRGFTRHGITTELGDSIKMDFSIYNDVSIMDSLKLCGLDSLVTTFKMEFPDKKRLVLSSNKAVLRFRKW